MAENKRPRAMRVALVMGGSVVAERTLDEAIPVKLGYGDHASLPLPAGVVEGDELLFMEPTADGGWEVILHPSMRGAIWTERGRVSVSGLPERVEVGETDYGVITLGNAALFFQRVGPAPKIGTGWLLDPNVLASVSLSTFLHAAALLLLFMAQRQGPADLMTQFDPDLIRRFMVEPPVQIMDEPEPESVAEADPQEREEPTGGDEGEATPEVGERAARAPAPAGNVSAPNVGLLRAIQGDEGDANALEAALRGPSIAGLLDRFRAGVRRPGRGRGLGLRRQGQGEGERERVRLGPIGPIVREPSRRRQRRTGPDEHRIHTEPPRRVHGPGYLPAGAIQRVVRRNQRSIRYCYELSLQRRPNLRGRVEIAWRIDRGGGVSSARLVSSTMGDARAEGCMVRQVRQWRFPEPDGGVVDVHYPFLFTQQ